MSERQVELYVYDLSKGTSLLYSTALQQKLTHPQEWPARYPAHPHRPRDKANSAPQFSRQMLGIQIDAVYHTSIVLAGQEIYYGLPPPTLDDNP